MNLNINNEKGFVASIVTMLGLFFMLALALSMGTLIFYRQKISANLISSTKAYYTAEAGTEDALLRLKNNPQQLASSYNLSVDGITTTVSLPEALGGARAITSQTQNSQTVKKIQVVYSVDGQGIAFHYGVQVGEGGMTMSNNSRVMGNIFSNGSVTGSGIVDDNIIIAGAEKKIDGLHVGGDALVYSCENSTVDGNLTYVSGGHSQNCNVGGTTTVQTAQIAIQPMPVSQAQIQQWKDEASVQVINGNVSLSNGQTRTMGPVKIIGSLSLSNNAVLKITGTIYVTGNISTSNGSVLRLDSSYGSLGGVILSDGTISVGNGATFNGSGQSGSYILVLSTNASSSAISISNNSNGAIFYTSNGGIIINNNTHVKEAVGYKISLSNNVVVEYDSGLENSFFSSGPGGGWKVTSWKEQ